MAQFYFLSVLLNILAGLILVYGKKAGSVQTESSADGSDEAAGEKEVSDERCDSLSRALGNMDTKNVRLVVGVLSVFVGIMKLLSVFRNDVPVVGDLFPALAGLAGGASLLLDHYISSSTVELELPGIVRVILIDSARYIGIACLVAALLHFVFPQAILL